MLQKAIKMQIRSIPECYGYDEIRNRRAPAKMPHTSTRDIEKCSIRAVGGEGNERKFVISFSSEFPVERWHGTEILDHSEGCADFDRLNDGGVVLFNHNRDAVIGKVNKAWLEENRGYAEIEFDTDEESEKIFQKVSRGTLKNVSMGYTINQIEEVRPNKKSQDGRFTGPAEIAKRWTPHEISIVSVPADHTVGIGRELEADTRTGADRSIDYFEAVLQINKNLLMEVEK